MSNERIKRDENKYIIASHYAFNKTFESLNYFEPEEYGVYYNRVAFHEEIMRNYERTYKLFKELHPNKIVTIFDKAICFGMVLRKYENFGCVRKGMAPRRIALLNEKYITEFMLAILHYSEYSVRAPGKGNGELISPTPFDLRTMFGEHMDVLEGLIRKIMVLLSEEEYKANEISDLLKEIYQLAILYGNGFDADDERTRKRIRVKEVKGTTNLSIEECDTLRWHREDLAKSVRR